MSPSKIDERPSAALAMYDHRPKRETMSIEEATISNSGRCSLSWKCSNKRDCVARKTSTISSPSSVARTLARDFAETACPEPYLLTETENKLIFLARRVRFQTGETRTGYFDIAHFYKKSEDLLRRYVMVN